jgi:hypothetical protein
VKQNYQDILLEMIKRLGYDKDNYFPDYAIVIAAARGEAAPDNQTLLAGAPRQFFIILKAGF